MFLNSRADPWCWRAMAPSAGTPGSWASIMTFLPLRVTFRISPMREIFILFHAPMGWSAGTFGTSAARIFWLSFMLVLYP